MFKKRNIQALLFLAVIAAIVGGLSYSAIPKIQRWLQFDGIVPPTFTTTDRDALTTPESGQTIYNSSTNTLNTHDGSIWNEVGSGAGVKNYITGGDAESGLTGFNLYKDAAAALPVDCTGGTSTLTLTADTTTPLSGATQFLVAKTAVDEQGEGFSTDFTIDRSDRAHMLTVSARFNVSTNDYDDADVIFTAFDVTNSKLIPITPQGLVGATGTDHEFLGQFQAASDSTSYRLCIHFATTNALAVNINLDDIFVGPTPFARGPPITDWEAYTPTITNFGSETSVAFQFRRVGDTLQVRGSFTTGTVVAAIAEISLPTGHTIDFTLLSDQSIVGYTQGVNAGSDGHHILADSADPVSIFFGREGATSAQLTNTNASNIAANTSMVSLHFEVDILGFSSNVQVSSDADTRVLAMRAVGATATLTGVLSDVTWTTIQDDTHSSMGSIIYTNAVAGFYSISGALFLSASSISVGETVKITLFKIGTGAIVENTKVYQGTNTNSYGHPFNFENIFLNSGEQIKIQALSQATSPVITASTVQNYLQIKRESGPAQIAASEKVFMEAHDASGQSIAANSTEDITFDTETDDSHGVFDGTTFTSPRAGPANISAGALSTSNAWLLGESFHVLILVNGVVKVRTIDDTQVAQTGFRGKPASLNTFLQAGDTVKIQVFNGDVSDATLLSNVVTDNWFSVLMP